MSEGLHSPYSHGFLNSFLNSFTGRFVVSGLILSAQAVTQLANLYSACKGGAVEEHAGNYPTSIVLVV